MNEIIEAKLLFKIFYNPTNYYAVLKMKSLDDDEKIIVTGYFKELDEDVVYRLHGNYVDHPKYGVQFLVESYETLIEKSTKSLIRYLSSSLFEGIGKKCASDLVEHLGLDVIELIKNDPHILDDLAFLNDKKREVIISVIMKEDHDLTMFFSKYGINARYLEQVDKLYGENAIDMIKENPYRLIEDFEGIGFESCDKIAMQLQMDHQSPYRIRAYIIHLILTLTFRSGDTYVLESDLMDEYYKHMNFDIIAILEKLINDKVLIKEEDRIYHKNMYLSERGIVNYLKHFPYCDSDLILEEEIRKDLKILQEQNHIQYDEQQILAILNFFNYPFSMITGGPGSGKTTIVMAIMQLYQKYFPNDRVCLCAPTGRASKRLSECSDCRSSTIHSLLHYDLQQNRFMKHKKDPLDVDLLIVDEFSMVDQWLFYNLLQASYSAKKILLIGDEDQLPSVGCGNVISDLLHCKLFKVSALTKVFRQSEESGIITLAHQIKNNELEGIVNKNGVLFVDTENEEQCKQYLLTMVQEALNKGYESKDIQVLAPMYKGSCGIDSLNNALQEVMNPYSIEKKEIKIGFRTFRIADKVLQLKNQSDYDVYNGDVGEIVDIKMENKQYIITASFQDNLCHYNSENINQLTHAFCVSVHKSQGGEYPIVMMPIVKRHTYMLDKRLLYTAITRAKKSLIIVGDQELFYSSLKKEDRLIRKTTLKKRLIDSIEY